MRRRLRKKKRLGEFAELGFEVLAQLRGDMSYAEIQAFLDRWIDAVEARELGFGGGTHDTTFQGFVTRARRGSASEADRLELGAFLEQDGDVVHHEVRELRDACYGWD